MSLDLSSNACKFIFMVVKYHPGFSCLLSITFLLSTLLVAGCTRIPPTDDPDAIAEYQQANDPVEPTNRIVLHINSGIDIAILKPVAYGYRALPKLMRDSVYNALTNWNEPLIFFHDMLQGEPRRAGEAMVRFVTNTTLGFFGVGDVASAGLDIPHHDEDMGQTLAVWGVSDGPYIMLPLLGPSNARDTAGRLVDLFIDPVSLIGIAPLASASRASMEGIARRERHLDMLDDLERTSLDYYASLRTLYQQRRVGEVSNGHRIAGGELAVGYSEKESKVLLED